MSRLPQVGGDGDAWGSILNDFLLQEHNPDGTLKVRDDGTVIESTIVTAKGDIITATGSSSPSRLGVGSNGQVLVADSAQSTGVKWSSPSDVGLKGFVSYGSNAATARPTGFTSVEWSGTVPPTNAAAGDTWVQTRPVNGYREEVLADSPLVYYRLDGVSGVDSGPNYFQMAFNGDGAGATSAPSLIVDPGDQATRFANNMYLFNGDEAVLRNLPALTVEAWVIPTSQPSANTYRPIFRNPGGDYRLAYADVSGTKRLRFDIGATSHTVDATLSLTAPSYVVGRYDGTDMRIFLNGTQVGGATARTGNTPNTGGSFYNIAADGGGSSPYWQGVIDEVAVYGTSLSTTRITAHFVAGGSAIWYGGAVFMRGS